MFGPHEFSTCSSSSDSSLNSLCINWLRLQDLLKLWLPVLFANVVFCYRGHAFATSCSDAAIVALYIYGRSREFGGA